MNLPSKSFHASYGPDLVLSDHYKFVELKVFFFDGDFLYIDYNSKKSVGLKRGPRTA